MELKRNAIAVACLVSGNLASGPEIADNLKLYKYERASEPGMWELNGESEADAGAALFVDNDGEAVHVFSRSTENMENLNYILQRVGYQSCTFICLDEEAEELVNGYISNVDVEAVTNLRHNALAAELASPSGDSPAVHEEPADEYSTLMVDDDTATDLAFTDVALDMVDPELTVPTLIPETGSVIDERLRIEELTERLNDEERLRSAAEDGLALANRQIAALQAQLLQRQAMATVAGSGSAPGQQPGEVALLAILERYVLSMVDLTSVNGSPLMKDLQAAGYGVALKLVANT